VAEVAVEWRLAEAPSGRELVPLEAWEKVRLQGTPRGADGGVLGPDVVVRCRAGLLDFKGLVFSRELGASAVDT